MTICKYCGPNCTKKILHLTYDQEIFDIVNGKANFDLTSINHDIQLYEEHTNILPEYKVDENTVIFNCILYLQSGEKCTVPMRSDGYINMTKICNAESKQLINWFSIRSQLQIDSISKLINIDSQLLIDKIIDGPLDIRGIYVHRDIALLIIYWVNNIYPIQVVKWFEEYLFLNNINKDDITQERKVNDSLKRSLARYEKAHNYVTFGIKDPCYYIFSYGRFCNENCRLRKFRKHGITIKNKKGKATLDVRLQTHRTTFPSLYLEYIISSDKDTIELIEKMMEKKYGDNLNPNNLETFEISLELLTSQVQNTLVFLGIKQELYTIIPQDQIDEYNHDVDMLIK